MADKDKRTPPPSWKERYAQIQTLTIYQKGEPALQELIRDMFMAGTSATLSIVMDSVQEGNPQSLMNQIVDIEKEMKRALKK